jgi:hypothetical protein
MTASQALGKLTLQSVHTGFGVLRSVAASGLEIAEGELCPRATAFMPAASQMQMKHFFPMQTSGRIDHG